MKAVIVSGSEGNEFAEIRKITWPRLEAYARIHGLDFVSGDLVGGLRRPSSWKKLVTICSALAVYETAIWVDADVYVLNFLDDIMAGVPDDCWQAMVRHKTNEGDVPNAGVWLVRRPMLPFLMVAAMSDEFVGHRWWEQAPMHAMMGFGIVGHESVLLEETQLYQHTHWLDESFNVCVYTPKTVKQNWLHACGMISGRIDAIVGWDEAAKIAGGKQ